MIKRYITSSGQVKYRNTDTGRFVSRRTGAREYVRQNIDTIRNNRTNGLRYNDLTTQERQSYSAQNRYRYNGEFIPNPFNYLRQLEASGAIPQGQRNLTNYFTREDLRQLGVFTQPYRVTSDGDGNAMRVRGQLYDVVSQVNDYLGRGYEFNIVTPNGDILTGIDAANYLRQWESQTIDRIRAQGLENGRVLDRILINYNISVDQTQQLIEIDLNEIDEDTDIDAYFDTP
jgi:hypothetical protein